MRRSTRCAKKPACAAHRYRAGVIREEIERIAGLQEAERRKQKKLEKSYEDFMKLLTFVETVEDDDFWRSEVVQITAKTTPSGALEVELTPRSGRFAVLFRPAGGRGAQVRQTVAVLPQRPPSIGWSGIPHNDIRYNDQVVLQKVKVIPWKKRLYRCRRFGLLVGRGGRRGEDARRPA